MIGPCLEGYRIHSVLGRGSSGTVYRAVRLRCGRMVALRVLHPEVHADPVRRSTFLEATRSLGALPIGGLAPLVEVIATPSVTGAAMVLLEGETLAERLLRGPVPGREAAGIAASVADTLDDAHAAGVSHRNLAPSNVYLDAGGGTLLLDFGLARPAGESEGRRADCEALERLAALMGAPPPPARLAAGRSRPGAAVRPGSFRSHAFGPGAAMAAALVACLALATGVAHQMSLPKTTGTGRPDRTTLAVLPLSTGGPVGAGGPADPGLTIADGIITVLGQSDLVKVRPTESIAGFAGAAVDPVAAGRALGVDRVLSGDLLVAGGAWRARLRLEDVRTGATIWTRTIDSDGPDFETASRRIREGVAKTIASEAFRAPWVP